MNNLNLFRREFSTFKHLYRIYQPLKPLQKPNIILYNVRCLSVANKKGYFVYYDFINVAVTINVLFH